MYIKHNHSYVIHFSLLRKSISQYRSVAMSVAVKSLDPTENCYSLYLALYSLCFKAEMWGIHYGQFNWCILFSSSHTLLSNSSENVK